MLRRVTGRSIDFKRRSSADSFAQVYPSLSLSLFLVAVSLDSTLSVYTSKWVDADLSPSFYRIISHDLHSISLCLSRVKTILRLPVFWFLASVENRIIEKIKLNSKSLLTVGRVSVFDNFWFFSLLRSFLCMSSKFVSRSLSPVCSQYIQYVIWFGSIQCSPIVISILVSLNLCNIAYSYRYFIFLLLAYLFILLLTVRVWLVGGEL